MTTLTNGNSARKHRSNAMNACKNMKSSLALWVGHDLDEAAEKEVRRHVANCEGCRDFSEELRGTQAVLEQAVFAAAPVSESSSIWPELRATLLNRARRSGGTTVASPRFSGFWRAQNWLPMGALAAACLTIWFGSNNDLPSEWPSVANRGKINQTTVKFLPSQDQAIRPAVEFTSGLPWNNPNDPSRPEELYRLHPAVEIPGVLDSDR